MGNESTTFNEQREGRASIARPLEKGQLGCQCSTIADEEENVLKDRIRRLLETDAGDMGVVIRAGLFSGLWQDELAYVYCMDICANDFGCNCSKLHAETKTSGITTIVVNWLRCQGNKKCYLAIMPTGVWERFRSLHSFTVRDVVIANWVTNKLAGVEFKELRSMHQRVTGSTMMDAGMTQVLYGSASPKAARTWMAQSGNLDRLGQEYCRAWHMFGIYSWGQV